MAEGKWIDLAKVSDKHRRISKKHAEAQAIDPAAELSAADADFEINYACFIQTLDLFAETCLHRNKEN